MERLRQTGRPIRAAIAVAALYGLLLQAFLSGLATRDLILADHGAICAPADSAGAAPAPGEGRRHDGQACCLAGCLGALPPLVPGSAGLAALVRYGRAVGSLREAARLPSGPAAVSPFEPRGPPAA